VVVLVVVAVGQIEVDNMKADITAAAIMTAVIATYLVYVFVPPSPHSENTKPSIYRSRKREYIFYIEKISIKHLQ
jgi:hypothetical protein